MRRALAALALFGAGALASVGLIEGGELTVYNSGNSSELIAVLPVYQTGAVTKHVVYCVDLGIPPDPGAVLHVDGDFQITDDLDYAPYLGGQLLLASSCISVSGVEISEGSGFNCSVGQRHCTATRSGNITVPNANTRRFVVFVAWASSGSMLWQSGDSVTVDADYGRLSVLRWT